MYCRPVHDKLWRPRAPCCEMRKAIWDKATGEQLAWIEDGKVFGVGMNEPVGYVREGKVFKHGGVFGS
jgi:hypothetical protein